MPKVGIYLLFLIFYSTPVYNIVGYDYKEANTFIYNFNLGKGGFGG